MTGADLDQVVAIEAVSFPDPWPRRFFEQEVAGAGTARAVVAVEALDAVAGSASREDSAGAGSSESSAGSGASEVVGYMVSWDMAGDIHLGNLAVAPRHRRRGIARLLLERLIRQAEQDGSRSVTLEVRVSNRAAIALYARHGFRPAGLRRGYYRGVEDALVMTRELAGNGPDDGTRVSAAGVESARDESARDESARTREGH